MRPADPDRAGPEPEPRILNQGHNPHSIPHLPADQPTHETASSIMFASTSAKLLTQPSKRLFCSCAPRWIQQVPGVGKEPTYTPPSAKPPRKNKSANPRKKAGSTRNDTELFAAVEGKTAINHRPTLVNEDSCRDLVRAWGIDKMHDAVILEPYAGQHSSKDILVGLRGSGIRTDAV